MIVSLGQITFFPASDASCSAGIIHKTAKRTEKLHCNRNFTQIYTGRPARGLWIQFAVLAGTFAVGFSIELLVASLASRISLWLRKVGRRFNQCCGAAFIAIGVALPLRT